jgi:hypothetical protein
VTRSLSRGAGWSLFLIAVVLVECGSASSAHGVNRALFPSQPGALALASNGGLYVADDQKNEIFERLPSGRFELVAGNGKRGFSGDGGAGVDAELNDPGGMAVAADGSLYFADGGNNRVRRIASSWTASGSTALAAPVTSPTAVAFSPGGRLYITTGDEVLRLERNGTLTRIAGIKRYAGVYGIGQPATNASADGANGLAFDGDGNLYLAGFNTKSLLLIDRQGTMQLPHGEFDFYPRGFGGLITGPENRVLAMNMQQIVEVTPHGAKPLYSFDRRKIDGVTGFLPGGIAIAENGTIYTDTDSNNGWSNGSAIIGITSGSHVHVLWRRVP